MSSPSPASLPSASEAPAPVSFSEAIRYWFRLGLVSFGGPAGQIAIMHQDLVEKRRWISEKRFLHALNYCMVLPGPEAQQLATYIGWLMHGVKGGIAAGLLFVLPALVLLILLAWVCMALGDLPLVSAVLWGIKPAVTAIVLLAAWRIGSRILKNPVLWGIALLAFTGLFLLHLSFPVIILTAALAGMMLGRIRPGLFQVSGGHAAKAGSAAPALIDDETPSPFYARFSWGRLLLSLGVGLGLWTASAILLAAAFGRGSLPVEMAGFFTKAALMTFGGAYAVLPYVYQAAVEHYHWLTAPQMMDGLALGETTPGPLIMIVTYVGFLGGWGSPFMGAESSLVSGVVAACVATLFTFLPSFVFILAGGPVVESTHGEMRLTAPLTAISAAVVGVIVNLALFFAGHVFWPQGMDHWPQFTAIVMSVAAFIAMWRYNVSVIRVIAACAACGVLLNFLA